MSCFDTLLFPCPSCGMELEEQSKYREDMKEYHLSDAPVGVLADIFEDRIHECHHCGVKFTGHIQRMVDVRKVDDWCSECCHKMEIVEAHREPTLKCPLCSDHRYPNDKDQHG